MFRRSVVRVHQICFERPLGELLTGKGDLFHEVFPDFRFASAFRDLNCVSNVGRCGFHTESDAGMLVEKKAVEKSRVTCVEVPKGIIEGAGTRLLKQTLNQNPALRTGTKVPSDDESKYRDVVQEVGKELQVELSKPVAFETNGELDQSKEDLTFYPLETWEESQFENFPGALYSSSSAGEEMDRKASSQAMSLLEAALDAAEEEGGTVRLEDQLSLRVAIVGAPNAGKSLLTNKLVGTRVSAVSRKTNTTHREHLGVYTKGDTQLCFYDTPGLHLDIEGSPLRVEAQSRVQSAWQTVEACEAVVVLVDAERQIRRPDRRVKKLVEKLGKEQVVDQKKILVLNKVDLIEQKRLLLPLAKEYESLPAYERIFMISGLTGSGVKDVKDYLLEQAIVSPWEESAEYSNHRDVALEIVREQVFEHLHEELPHTTKQKLVSWKVLKDGSIRIQQLLLVAKKEHQKILVGKNGAVIGEIGIKARKELALILGVNVHLVLDVKYISGAE